VLILHHHVWLILCRHVVYFVQICSCWFISISFGAIPSELKVSFLFQDSPNKHALSLPCPTNTNPSQRFDIDNFSLCGCKLICLATEISFACNFS
jgi:hypothetical protein